MSAMTGLEQFNTAFNTTFTEPLPGGWLEKIVDYARVRGRDDIADKIEEDFRELYNGG